MPGTMRMKPKKKNGKTMMNRGGASIINRSAPRPANAPPVPTA